MNAGGHSLVTTASKDKLLIKRKKEFIFHKEHLSIKELTELLVTVKDLLRTLKSTVTSRGAKTLCEGNEVLDSNLDETYIANLEHLLLCLRDQLLRLLIAKLVDLVHKHVAECQRDQRKHSEEWFFEYPDARHPLSTTWPWSIRPSLAVIWGVCWMFYDSHDGQPLPDPLLFDLNGNMVNAQGEVIAVSHAVQHYLSDLQRQRQVYYTGETAHHISLSLVKEENILIPSRKSRPGIYATASTSGRWRPKLAKNCPSFAQRGRNHGCATFSRPEFSGHLPVSFE